MVAMLEQNPDTYPEEFETEAGFESFEVPQVVLDELIKGRHFQRVQAEKEQRMAAAMMGERQTLPFGEVTMQVHPTIFHYWGQRLGYACWDDEQFCREMCRDNPELRVKSRSGKIQVGYTKAPKFRKTYQWKDS